MKHMLVNYDLSIETLIEKHENDMFMILDKEITGN